MAVTGADPGLCGGGGGGGGGRVTKLVRINFCYTLGAQEMLTWCFGLHNRLATQVH